MAVLFEPSDGDVRHRGEVLAGLGVARVKPAQGHIEVPTSVIVHSPVAACGACKAGDIGEAAQETAAARSPWLRRIARVFPPCEMSSMGAFT